MWVSDRRCGLLGRGAGAVPGPVVPAVRVNWSFCSYGRRSSWMGRLVPKSIPKSKSSAPCAEGSSFKSLSLYGKLMGALGLEPRTR